MTSEQHGKRIRLSHHASEYLDRRGFTEADVIETIRGGIWLPAKKDRMEAAKDFSYNREWNGRHYATKRIRAIFVEEEDEIAVVTVYTDYF